MTARSKRALGSGMDSVKLQAFGREKIVTTIVNVVFGNIGVIVAETWQPPATSIGTKKMAGGERYSKSKEKALAALVSAPSIAEAARMAHIPERTLRSWLRRADFVKEYATRRKELVRGAQARLHNVVGKAVDTLESKMSCGHAPTEVRAAVALLRLALSGPTSAETIGGTLEPGHAGPTNTGDVVKVLAARLQELEGSEVAVGEKARVTATLADALLRAMTVHDLDLRIAAVEAVLATRNSAATEAT
jgi:hypothetical protein